MFIIRTKNLKGKNVIPHYSYIPIAVSFSVLGSALSLVAYMHGSQSGFRGLVIFFLLLILCLIRWWRSLFSEFSTYEKKIKVENGKVVLLIEPASFRKYVQEFVKGTKVAMILFIISEVMFFFSFFWAFFHSLGSPAIQIGGVWPPAGLESVMPNPLLIPLANTLILLTSGVTVTWAHFSLLPNILSNTSQESVSSHSIIGNFIISMFLTLILAINFISWQGYEFIFNSLQMSDGIYGSTFYILTGFHGFHVIIGTIFLAVFFFQVLLELVLARETKNKEAALVFNLISGQNVNLGSGYDTLRVCFIPSVGFDCSVWYWHFVDVVWLFLFTFVYLPDYLISHII
jgi:heme/copper-type cytochrome/quinol oxidase subunit 3